MEKGLVRELGEREVFAVSYGPGRLLPPSTRVVGKKDDIKELVSACAGESWRVKRPP